MFDPNQIAGVAHLEASRPLSIAARSLLPPGRGDRGSETAATDGDGIVDGQRGELALERREST